jgi:hypothetical protein
MNNVNEKGAEYKKEILTFYMALQRTQSLTDIFYELPRKKKRLAKSASRSFF